MKSRTRRVMMFTGGMVAAWTVASFMSAEMIRPVSSEAMALNPVGMQPAGTWPWRIARAAVAGLWAGLFASFLELRILPRYAVRLGIGVMLGIRTVVYALVAWIAVIGTVRFMARREFGVTGRELFLSEGFQEFVHGPGFFQLIAAFIIASFLINGAVQVARLLGPGSAAQILLGRYLRPVEEDRAFLFVDLVDSTALAERLGPLAFAEFKNDFFHDLSEPVLDTRGQIVQYVGDEALITWPLVRGTRNADCLRCYFDFIERVEERAEAYEARYQCVPRFKGGLHCGRVVVSQLGDLKREIVFSGDPVNTTARIRGLCGPLGADFLVSQELMSRLELPEGLSSRDLGEQTLRGRTAPVRVFSVDRTVNLSTSGQASAS